MSIVEKAADKLRALQPEPQVRPSVSIEEPPIKEPVIEAEISARVPPTVERLQESARPAERTKVEAAAQCHIDEVALMRAGLLPNEGEADGRLGDEVRRAKRPLLTNASGRTGGMLARPQRIMVTSAVPGEGKTFTAMNLALSLAREPDFEVLLVDGDVPKSDLTRVLGLEGRPGLMDVLANERLRPQDVIVQTDVTNLLVLPAGENNPLATELFGGRRMEYVLDALSGKERQRLIVFDSSPLLATAESQVLASHMGQVVMVVCAGRTSQSEVATALESLSDSQYVGLILNMSRLPAIENHYYGRYQYSQQNTYQLQDH